MALHFVVDSATSGQPGDLLTLTGTEAHHAATVRRVRDGESVTLGDGRGAWLTAIVESVAPKSVDVRVVTRAEEPVRRPRLILAQALAKGDRDELAIQAATELGVDAIIPWQAARSVSRWDAAKAAKGVARWSTIVREAAKQAHRAWVPEVDAPAVTADLVARARESRVIVLEPSAEMAVTSLDLAADDDRDIVLVVGPEGGITPEELATLAEAGAVLTRLGSTVLRTSTAGPAAIAAVNIGLGRW